MAAKSSKGPVPEAVPRTLLEAMSARLAVWFSNGSDSRQTNDPPSAVFTVGSVMQIVLP
jgi:hypothetical protein